MIISGGHLGPGWHSKISENPSGKFRIFIPPQGKKFWSYKEVLRHLDLVFKTGGADSTAAGAKRSNTDAQQNHKVFPAAAQAAKQPQARPKHTMRACIHVCQCCLGHLLSVSHYAMADNCGIDFKHTFQAHKEQAATGDVTQDADRLTTLESVLMKDLPQHIQQVT